MSNKCGISGCGYLAIAGSSFCLNHQTGDGKKEGIKSKRCTLDELSKTAEAVENHIELTYQEIHQLNHLIRSAASARLRVKELNRLLNQKELEYSQIMDQIHECQLEDLADTAPFGVVIIKENLGGMK